jgi:transposase-like protein
VEGSYQIASVKDRARIVEFLSKEGQVLLPLVDLVEEARLAVDELVEVVGRATIEAVLVLSAQGLAGPKHRGKATGKIRWHGRQAGRVCMSDRKVRVDRPRLRRKGKGRGAEVEVPAYEAMVSNPGLGKRMLDVVLAGVSTRNYGRVIPEMAETVGVSRSAVSRELVEVSEEELRRLLDRRFDDADLIVMYIDGLRFGEHHLIVAVGVDAEGHKHVLGLADGATENAAVVRGLLEDLVERGVKPGRRRLFVIDGSKALRKAIDEVFGPHNPVQRCRRHKVKNVTDYLPKDLKGQMAAAMKAAYRLPFEEGLARMKKQAQWLEVEYPSAAASLLEGLEETFTVNRLGLSGLLRRSLSTTNIIENPNSVVRRATRRVSHWRNGKMVLRWAASAYLDAEKRFYRIMGYRDLWMLKSLLDDGRLEAKREVA